jgi:starvation-inducible DNA-binding protein
MTTADHLKVVLADTFGFYLNAHNFHWNVEGRDFVQLHDLFGNIYEDAHGAVDKIAEIIRSLNAYAPGSYTRFKDLTSVPEEVTVPSAASMIQKLLMSNEVVIRTLRACVETAKQENLEEVVNFLGGRLEAHTKHSWMLRSLTKTDRE